MGVSGIEYREALMLNARVQREADRLGPIYYEMRKERHAKRREWIQQVSAFLAGPFNLIRMTLSPSLRAQRQAEVSGAQ